MKVETSLNNKKEKVGPALREELSRRKLARSSFKEFIRFIKPNYVFKRFHEIIIDEIQKWIDVPGSKLILSMPRQLGKSEICGRLLPAYLFGIDADAPIIAASCTMGRAIDNSRDVQRIIDSKDYQLLFPNTKLQTKGIKSKSSVKRTEEMFEIVDRDGKYKCCSTEGSIVGFSSKYGIIDDPHNGHADGTSYKSQEKAWSWYNMDFLGTGTVDQRVLIVTTRWSKDDLVGKMIRDHNFSENWKHIVFPLIALGIAEQGPYEYREPGEILWPEEYTEEQIIEAKRDSYIFACMYQQDPIIRSGGIIDRSWIMIRHDLPFLISITMYWDIATSSTDGSDSTVCVIIGRTREKRGIILYVDGFKLDPDKRNTRMLQVCQTYSRLYPKMKMYAENLIMAGRPGTNEMRNFLLDNNIAIKMDNPRGSKFARSITITDNLRSAFEAQRIDFYDGYNENDWIGSWFDEVLQMRFIQTSKGPDWDALHDDYWDATASCWNKSNVQTVSAVLFGADGTTQNFSNIENNDNDDKKHLRSLSPNDADWYRGLSVEFQS